MPAARADLGVLLRRTVLVGGALPAWDRRLTPRGRYLTVQLVAERLGRYRVRAARARRTDPVRLMTTLSVAGPDETLLVYPRFWHLDQFDVPVGRSYQPGGIPLASSTGDAIEFVGTRDYREGDPIKNIHWRSWARRGKPVVKEYQEEYFSRVAIILDTYLKLGFTAEDRAAFEGAVSTVASVADWFSRAGAAGALGLRSGLAAMFSIVLMVAACVELPFPRPIVTGATRLARVGAVMSVVGGVLLTLYPVFPERLILGITSAAGHVLLLCAGVLLLGRTPPGNGVVPAALGAMVAAFLQPEPGGLRVTAGLAIMLLVAWLATTDDDRRVARSLRPLSLSIFVLLSAAIAVGIAILLPWAQPQVEVLAARMISNDLEAATRLSTESRLGEVERLGQKRIALRLYADRAVDLRVRTFTRFDGRAWKVDPRPGQRLAPLDVPAGRLPAFDEMPGTALAAPGATAGAALVSACIVVRSAERGVMPAPAHTVVARVEDVTVDQNRSGILLPGARAALYAVLFADGDTVEAPPGPEMLALPDKIDPRLRELAASLGGDSVSAGERLDRVVSHFRAGYHYTLEVGKFQTAEPVAEFVFEKKKGYCECFATATALLLRLSGVPARYVTGYAVRPFQRLGTHYIVRDSDAHAWTEPTCRAAAGWKWTRRRLATTRPFTASRTKAVCSRNWGRSDELAASSPKADFSDS